ncbi:hypothetical protein AAG906_018653 [Vitis piasezkii]
MELRKAFEICLLQELKHFPIDHTGWLMLEMLPMHTFKHMRSQKLFSLVSSLEASEINTILLLIVPLDSLKSTCHLVSP